MSEARLIREGSEYLGGEEVAFSATAYPARGEEQGDTKLFVAPGLGTANQTAREVALIFAEEMGLPTVAYAGRYGSLIKTNPFRDILRVARDTALQLFDTHAPGERPSLVAQSAQGIVPVAVLDTDRELMAGAIFISSIGWTFRSQFPQPPDVQAGLDAMPLVDRLIATAALGDGEERAIGLLGRFAGNGLSETWDMLRAGDFGPLTQALQGMTGEFFDNRHLAEESPLFPGWPVALGAFAVGGSLDNVGTVNQLADMPVAERTLVGIAHEYDDPIESGHHVEDTLVMPGVHVDVVRMFDIGGPRRSGHDMLNSTDGRHHVAQIKEVWGEMQAIRSEAAE